MKNLIIILAAAFAIGVSGCACATKKADSCSAGDSCCAKKK